MGIQVKPHKMKQVNLDEDLELYCVEFRDWDSKVYVFEEFTYSLCGIISRLKSSMQHGNTGVNLELERILSVSVQRDGERVELWN